MAESFKNPFGFPYEPPICLIEEICRNEGLKQQELSWPTSPKKPSFFLRQYPIVLDLENQTAMDRVLRIWEVERSEKKAKVKRTE